MFSIIIPTLNNLNYLKLCIKSLKTNSSYNHQIIPHVNIGEDGTIDFLEKEKIVLFYMRMMIFIFVLNGILH